MLLYAAVLTIAAQDQRGGYGDARTSIVGVHVGVMYVPPIMDHCCVGESL